VAITLIVTWALWPSEQPLAPGGQAVSAGEPAAVAEFPISAPRWSGDQGGALGFCGDLVVWAEAAAKRSGIFAADVRMHQRYALQRTPDRVQQNSPVVTEKLLAWTQRGAGDDAPTELWIARPLQGKPFSLAATPLDAGKGKKSGAKTSASVRAGSLDADGDLVVWLARVQDKDYPDGADDRICIYDSTARAVSFVKAAAGPKTGLAVDEGLVAWSGRDENAGVWVQDTRSGQTIRASGSPAVGVDISGDRVVWCSVSGDVYGYDLRTRRRFTICAETGVQADVHIDGSLVVWWDGRSAGSGSGNALSGARGDIYARDLAAGKEVAVCTDKAAQESPRVCGDTVVWLDARSGEWQVRGAVVGR